MKRKYWNPVKKASTLGYLSDRQPVLRSSGVFTGFSTQLRASSQGSGQ